MSRGRAGTTEEELPRWKLLVAAGVLGGVAVVTLAVVAWRWLGPSAAEDSTTEPPRATASTTPSPSAVDAPASAAPPARRSEDEREALVATVRDALDAWETFARSGDTDDVAGTFVVGGPQFRQFRREARQGLAGPGVGRVPDMRLRSVGRIEGTGRRRNVVARVALRGDGERDARRWMFVLERHDGTWRVWTVVDRTAAT